MADMPKWGPKNAPARIQLYAREIDFPAPTLRRDEPKDDAFVEIPYTRSDLIDELVEAAEAVLPIVNQQALIDAEIDRDDYIHTAVLLARLGDAIDSLKEQDDG